MGDFARKIARQIAAIDVGGVKSRSPRKHYWHGALLSGDGHMGAEGTVCTDRKATGSTHSFSANSVGSVEASSYRKSA
eukprot:2239511-Amphidinium_carterae.2